MINWFTVGFTYLVVWWIVIFMVLPFGVKPPEEVEKGHSTGAPAVPHLGKKALATTVLSAIITFLFFYFTQGVLVAPE